MYLRAGSWTPKTGDHETLPNLTQGTMQCIIYLLTNLYASDMAIG